MNEIMCQLDINTKYSETMASIRHYSNLRFAMLTIFVAITGGLFSVLAGDKYPDLTSDYKIDIVRVAGAWVSVSFFIFETVLNLYLSKMWGIVDSISGVESSDRFRNYAKWIVRIAAGSIPFAIGVFWFFLPYFKQ